MSATATFRRRPAKNSKARCWTAAPTCSCFFIEKCAHHLRDGGELIFITPRDFLKLTAASRLNRMLHDSGTITDCIENRRRPNLRRCLAQLRHLAFCQGRFFAGATADGRKFSLMNGQIAFVQSDYTAPLADIFAVKVGAVSGMDAVFCQSPATATAILSARKRRRPATPAA